MTISTESTRVEYTGDGATLPFAVPFKFLVKTDIVVVLRTILTGVDAVQTLYTHYTVTGAGDASGTVTFVTAPPSTQRVVIYNDPPLTQLVDYIAGGTFPAETHEEALDRLTIQQKRTREITTRAILLPDADTDGSGAYDAKSNRIKNLGAPIATTDAATKTYTDTLVNNTALGPAPTGLIATGSVTSRLLADRWADVGSVKDFGAVAGDSSGAAQTANVAAFHAAMVAHKRVHVPAGVYHTDATIEIQQSGQRLSGDVSASGGTAINITASNTNAVQSSGNSDVEISDLWIYVKGSSGVGYYHYGGAWLNLHDCTVYPDGTGGTGVVLDDRNSSGVLVSGSYTHRLDLLNMARGPNSFATCIKTAGTAGGINATNISNCHLRSDLCVEWLAGGGGSVSNNLMQSATGTSGTPVGFGFKNTGGTNSFSGNYMERFAYDVFHNNTTEGSAPVIVTHHSDNSTNIIGYNSTATDQAPLVVSGSGIESHVLREIAKSVAADGEAIILTGTSLKITGNGAPKYSCTLSTSVARNGALCYVRGSSWAVQILESTTADFGPYASSDGMIFGQEGSVIAAGGVTRPVFSSALFYFNGSASKWEVLNATTHRASGGGNYERQEVNADGAVVQTDARTISITGNGAVRSNCTLEAPVVDGQMLTIAAVSWGVQIVPSTTAIFAGGAVAVTFSNTAVQSMNLVSAGLKWYEISRAVNSVGTYAATNVSADRAYDANATTTAELADVLGTLIADLRLQGIVK
jgi:hypothetical protein